MLRPNNGFGSPPTPSSPLVEIDLPNAAVVVVVLAVAERFIVAECAFSVAEARVGENGLPPFLLLLVTPALLLLLMLLLLLLLGSNEVEESMRANCSDERRDVKRSSVVCASHFGSAVVVAAALVVACFVEPVISF